MVRRTYHSENRRICNSRKRHKGAGGIGLVFSRRQRFRRHLQDLARTAETVADPLCRPLKDFVPARRGMVGGPTSGPGRLQRQCARSVAEQLIEAAEHSFKTLRVKNPQVAAEAI